MLLMFIKIMRNLIALRKDKGSSGAVVRIKE
jgi:hypothetical protein